MYVRLGCIGMVQLLAGCSIAWVAVSVLFLGAFPALDPSRCACMQFIALATIHSWESEIGLKIDEHRSEEDIYIADDDIAFSAYACFDLQPIDRGIESHQAIKFQPSIS